LVAVKVNGSTVFEKEVDTEQGYIKVPITGKGTVYVEVFFDGQLTYSDPFTLTD